MSLEKLSNEILIEIIEILHEKYGNYELLSLAKCSKRLYALTIPTLYRQFEPRTVKHLVLFTEIVFNTSRFAAFVHSVRIWNADILDIPESENGTFENEDVISFKSKNTYVILEKVLGQLGYRSHVSSVWEAWVKEVKYLPRWSTLALLLCLLPRVQVLELPLLDVENLDEPPSFAEFINKMANTQESMGFRVSPMRTLTKVVIADLPYERYDEFLRTILPLLSMKQLSSLEVAGLMAPKRMAQMVRTHNQAEYTISRLEFTESTIPGLDLIELLKRCTKLEEFVFHTLFEDPPAFRADCSPYDIVEGLSHLKDRLRTLDIACRNSVLKHKQSWSLIEFKALENLVLDASAIMLQGSKARLLPDHRLSSKIPNTLKSLSLECLRDRVNDMINAIAQLHELLDISDKSAPWLKDIGLAVNDEDVSCFSQKDHISFSDLMGKCKRKGIKLDLSYLDLVRYNERKDTE